MPALMAAYRDKAFLPLVYGLMLALAYAPYDAWLFAFLSPALLIHLWHRTDWHQAPMQGFFFGIGWFSGGLHWIYYSIYQYGGTPFWVSVILNALLIALMAVYIAALGWLGRRYLARLSFLQQCLGVTLLWPLMEWFRGVFLTGFPWLSLGYSHLNDPLAGFAPVLGVYGVGFMSLLVSVGLALLAGSLWRRGQWTSSANGIVGAGFVVAILLLGMGLQQVQWTQASGKDLHIAIVQGNIDQGRKWSHTGRVESLRVYQQMSRENWGQDLVVWPETSVPYFYDDAKAYLMRLSAEARRADTALLVGVPIRESGGDYFNSVIGLGAADGRYDKQHLVPFGEYVPLKMLLGELLQFLRVPMSNFTAGDTVQTPIVAGKRKLATSICYEDLFARDMREQVLASEMLVNVTNDGWFGDTVAPAQHLQIARMRALEFGRGMVRAANTGVSALIDAKGNIVSQSRQGERTVLTGRLTPKTGGTPYSHFGDAWLSVLLALLVFGWAYVRWRDSVAD